MNDVSDLLAQLTGAIELDSAPARGSHRVLRMPSAPVRSGGGALLSDTKETRRSCPLSAASISGASRAIPFENVLDALVRPHDGVLRS